MPAGTGAEPHSHPNEQWIFVVEGMLRASIGNEMIEAKPGTVLYVPANAVHSVKATPHADGAFFTVKDAAGKTLLQSKSAKLNTDAVLDFTPPAEEVAQSYHRIEAAYPGAASASP